MAAACGSARHITPLLPRLDPDRASRAVSPSTSVIDSTRQPSSSAAICGIAISLAQIDLAAESLRPSLATAKNESTSRSDRRLSGSAAAGTCCASATRFEKLTTRRHRS